MACRVGAGVRPRHALTHPFLAEAPCPTLLLTRLRGSPFPQVCWSPFVPSLFLTASADWSVRLWSESQPRSLWMFQLPSSRAEVADVAFCPSASTVFAAAAGNTLQLWDVERSVLAPRATATRFGVRLTALAFSRVGAAGAPSLGEASQGLRNAAAVDKRCCKQAGREGCLLTAPCRRLPDVAPCFLLHRRLRLLSLWAPMMAWCRFTA